MKKILRNTLILAFSLVCVSAFSQEKRQRELKEVPEGVMPQQGDISLGVSLKPILNYAGNMFNGTSGNGLNDFAGEPLMGISAYSPDYSIMGKYMLSDKMAVRANLGLMGSNYNDRSYVQDDAAVRLNPLSEDQVIDVMKTKINGFTLSVGAEFHKRYRRIQGYAGASLFYGRVSITEKFTYGNDITSANQNPSNAGYGPNYGGGATPTPPDFSSLRMLENKYEKSNAFGLVPHVGVEWFFAPKVSIGGEISIPLLYSWGGQSYTKYEGFNTAKLSVEEYTKTNAPGDKEFSYATTNLGGNIFINFYF